MSYEYAALNHEEAHQAAIYLECTHNIRVDDCPLSDEDFALLNIGYAAHQSNPDAVNFLKVYREAIYGAREELGIDPESAPFLDRERSAA